MGKKASIVIKESIEELKFLYEKERDYKKKLRIKSLILTKTNKFKTRLALSEYLGIGLRTLFNWTKNYQTEGVESMLSSVSGGSRTRVITKDIKKSLQDKLHNSTNPLQGYNDAVEWIKNKHNVVINYHTLRSFMIVNFGTKLKTPRKSHYKKDEEAFETFKKTSILTSTTH